MGEGRPAICPRSVVKETGKPLQEESFSWLIDNLLRAYGK